MPFWQYVQRCENCKFWHRNDPSDYTGVCRAEVEADLKLPFWREPEPGGALTVWDQGTACPAYKHERDKPHILDDARAFLALVEEGDRIPMRTYSRGEPQRAMAEVMRRNNRFITIRFLNAHYRMRLNATLHAHAGTIMGMEEWGVDVYGRIERAEARTEHPERAVEIIKAAHVGSIVELIGYPPFHRMRKTAKVLGKTDQYLTIRIDRHRRKMKMHAAGPLAGIIEGEVWTLDTTGDTHHDQAGQAASA